MKSLAIDTTKQNKDEAERWTKLFLAIYNSSNVTFYLKDLKEAVSKLPRELELILVQNFELFGANEFSKEITPQKLSEALEALSLLDAGETAYSTFAKINHLTQKQNNVILHNDYFEEWNVEIQDLNLSTRIKNALVWNGIKTLNDLFSTPYQNIVRIRNIGKKSLEEEILPLFKEHGANPLKY